MQNEIEFKKNISGQKANDFLKEHGLNISVEQTNVVVDYLYGLAQTLISNEKSNLIHTSKHR